MIKEENITNKIQEMHIYMRISYKVTSFGWKPCKKNNKTGV